MQEGKHGVKGRGILLGGSRNEFRSVVKSDAAHKQASLGAIAGWSDESSTEKRNFMSLHDL